MKNTIILILILFTSCKIDWIPTNDYVQDWIDYENSQPIDTITVIKQLTTGTIKGNKIQFDTDTVFVITKNTDIHEFLEIQKNKLK